MDSELIMRSDVLDILFEKRNKDYGAYKLRKFYKYRLVKSLAIMTAAVIVFSAFTFLPAENIKTGDFIVIEPEFGKIPPLPKIPELRPKMNKPAITRPASTLTFISNMIMVDKADSAAILRNLDDRAIASNTNMALNETGTQLVGEGATGKEIIVPVNIMKEPVADISQPIDNPEIMPQYPGGMAALRKFLVRNLTNPRDLEPGELVSVKVKFVVGYDGKVQRFELVEDGGTSFNNEVIRVLKKMPEWIPGKSKGRNVSVYYAIPVKFVGED